MSVGIIPKEGVRVVSTFAFLRGMRGTIMKAHDTFAYVKWDKDGKKTSEYYDVIMPEQIWIDEGLDECH